MRRKVSLGVLVWMLLVVPASRASKPPKFYIDKGLCPLECCTYGEWIARKEMRLVQRPNGKKVVAMIAKGERVQGLTGEVHSIPAKVTTEREHPEAGLKTGETVYVLNYLGEGHFRAWHKGKLIEIENMSDEGPFPQMTWWVKVKTTSGVVGWTTSLPGSFEKQDACGEPAARRENKQPLRH